MANETNETISPQAGGESFLDTLLDFLSHGTEFAKFLAIVVGAFFLGRGIRWIYMWAHKGRPTSAQLLAGKGIMLIMVFAGIWLGIRYAFSFDPVSLLATLGIVSLALGFGLQNTVANLAAGMSLSLDKPFDVGDRIQVGQTWGDVISIGFRSTTIRTTAGEHVIIPNAILDTQEVWNYTSGGRTEMRLEIPVQISYASSVALAEDICLRVTRDVNGVMAYPEPRVLVRAFAADGVDLEIRCWLADPMQKAVATDAILRRVKARFDDKGVHFPFQQRTISYLKDEEPPASTPEHLSEEHAGKPVILALIKSPLSSPSTPQHLVHFAKEVDARLVFLHVRPPAAAMRVQAGQAALNKCVTLARDEGLSGHARMEVGNPAKIVAQVARQEGAKLVVLVRVAKHGLGKGWQRSELAAIQRSLTAPVQLLEPDTAPVEKTMAFWRERLHPDPAEVDASSDD